VREYVVNNNQTRNPGMHHEVHTTEHARQLSIRDYTYLGWFASAVGAVNAAKRIYFDTDGCAICCPEAHTG